jgi:hypothetical protein
VLLTAFASGVCAAASFLSQQSSYSDDGIFISVGASSTTTTADGEHHTAIMSTLFAYSKKTLYDVIDPADKVYAATYLGAGAWKSSIAYKEQALIKEDYR